MNLNEPAYAVLVVSASEKFSRAVSELLPGDRHSPIRFANNISTAKRAVAEEAFDYIIINSPLPDDMGVRFAIDSCHFNGTVVLLIVPAELHDEIHDKVLEHGVFTLPRPMSKNMILTALGWMASARERLRRFEKKSLSIEEKMSEIRSVNRAKWVLIRELKMEEPEAHRYIEKQAMDRCISKREVAEEIIKTYL